MDIHFSRASNDELTCRAGTTQLHSAYNPSREAERFAESISSPFSPRYLLVTGPALSYCAAPLRTRFKGAVFCAVQYTRDFTENDAVWDKVFYSTADEDSLSEQLYTFMGEEGLVSCCFASWKPSETAFAEEYRTVWNAIKKAVLKGRSVLATRSFFAKRWLKNSLRFCAFARHTASLSPGGQPVVVCASGPSLFPMLHFLRKTRRHFFLLAVSSALSPLLHYSIVPDLCISTDGGYWAKRHLGRPLSTQKKIPVALPAEAACFARAFSEGTIVPLSYGDGPAEQLLKACSYKAQPASRNGSVSGSAADLALSLTTGPVFFCGLDLEPSPGFSHTQPNELELTDAVNDSRLSTGETRCAKARFSSESLSVYRSWFATAAFKGRLFRLCKTPYSEPLGTIADVDEDFFLKTCSRLKNATPITIHTHEQNTTTAERVSLMNKIIDKNRSNPEWIKAALPAEAVTMERSLNTQEEAKALKAIEKGMERCARDLKRAIGRSIQ